MRSLPLAAAAAAVLFAPTAAHAATDFTGVTGDNQVVTFTSQSAGYLESLAASTGLTPGAKVVGLDKAPDGRLLALDSTGRVSSLQDHTFTPLFGGQPVIAGGVPTAAASTFSIAADGASALVVTDTQALRLDLASGAVTPTTSPTGTANVALDQGADGRFAGLDGATGKGLYEPAPGAAFGTIAKSDVPSGGRTTVTVAPDGSAWGVRGIDFKNRTDRQSFFVKIDPKLDDVNETGIFFQRPITALAATGTSPDVTAAPKATITIAKRQSLRDIRRHGGLQVSFTSNQAGQRVASARRGKLNAGFNADLGELATPGKRTLTIRGSKNELKRITLGSHITVRVSVHGIGPKTTTAARIVTITR